MTKTFKKSVAFISAAVMVMTMLLYFPSGIFRIDFGLKASAAAITLSAPTEGDGSSDNPYQISTKEELYWFAACVNGTDGVTRNTAANAVLTADIVVNENVLNADGTPNGTEFTIWTPIGTSINGSYIGTFEGKNHTISGLYFNDSSTEFVGLFGSVEGGSVSNVGVVDSYFRGKNGVGGVCGANSGTITNCYNTGNVSGSRGVGGVCGANNNPAKITNCYNTGIVSATDNDAEVGGVCGYNEGTITNCYYLDTCAAVGTTFNCNEGTSKTSAEMHTETFCKALGYHSQFDEKGFCGLCKNGYQPAIKTTHKYNIDGVEGFDEVYEISNKSQLYWFAQQVNNGNTSINAVLTANITVNSNVLNADGTPNGTDFTSWTPIGTSYSRAYTGKFDGQNHTISGLYYNNTDSTTGKYIGLFGYVGDVGENGSVSNVGVVDSYFKAYDYVGGVCGENHVFSNGTATITNCYNTGNITATGTYAEVGGVCGHNVSGTITNCYNTGNVTATGEKAMVGGVCGKNNSGTITNSYNTGNVTATGEKAMVGGVCGQNYYGTITNCYNTGAVSVTANNSFVGGVCGYNDSSGTITNCHYDSTVYSGNAVGKDYATGTNAVGKITDDFKRGEVAYLLQSGQTAVNGIIPEVWGQTIGTDKSPVLGGEKVYATTGCVTYNNSSDTSKKEHKYDDNGFCACNGYESANLTTDKYNIDGVDGFDEVYEISNAGQLYWFAQLVNSRNTSVNAVLTDNITVNSNLLSSLEYDKEDNVTNGASFRSWTPIGTSYSIAYTGKFDGQNHTISGLYYYNTYSTIGIYIGLFGYVGDVGENGSVSNVGVVDSYFKAYDYVGGVCGENHVFSNGTATITNCYNTGNITATGTYAEVGGVCGHNVSGTITNCYNTGNVTATGEKAMVGGVCGKNNSGTITNSYNTGNVTATGEKAMVGGVCGYNYKNTTTNKGTITNCYSLTGTATQAVGYDSESKTYADASKDKTVFHSGEVAYLLSQGENGSVWGQDLSVDDSYPVLGGKKVLANSDQSDFVNDIIIYGQNAALDGTIDFNIYVAADDNYEWSAKIDGAEVTKPAKDENGLYKFTCKVAAKDMAKDIEFYINENVKATVSVKTYLDALDTSGNKTLTNLVAAMKTYGTAADKFFNGGNVDPVDSFTAETLSGYTFTKNDAPEGISYYGSSLLLKSETTVRHYFKLANGKSIGDFTFTVDANTVTPVEKQGYYYIDIENISADKLGTGFTVSINGEDVITNYSALSYVYKVLDSDSTDDNLKNLVKTLYLYNQKALAYNAA